MYRAHPATGRIVELVRDGAIGEVRHIEASFGFNAPFRADSRLFANELAGGGIMDVGCYPVSMSRLIAAAAAGVPPGEEEPVDVQGSATFAETGVDACAAAVLRFPSGVVAQVATAVAVGLQNRVVISGSEGAIRIAEPWRCADENGDWSFELVRGGESETVSGNSAPLYVHEVDAVSEALARGAKESPCMSWADSLGNARALDAWRRSIGLEFDQERPERQTTPVHGRPLRLVQPTMQHGAVRGIDKPISRLVMGCDNQPDIAHAAVMFDHYFEHGGNTFDTAHIYGGGQDGVAVGRVDGESRRAGRRGGDRQGCAHASQLPRPGDAAARRDAGPTRDRPRGSLLPAPRQHGCGCVGVDGRAEPRVRRGPHQRLRRIELVPCAGAGGECLRRAERPQAVRGGVEQFQPGADGGPGVAGLHRGFDAGLARLAGSGTDGAVPLVEPGAGVLHAARFDAAQAEAPAAAALTGNQPSDAEMRRCWFADDNFARRERAVALAEERGVEPIVVALAWVLNQPFPCFPLVGPRQLSETRSSLKALDVALDAEQMAWLYGEA